VIAIGRRTQLATRGEQFGGGPIEVPPQAAQGEAAAWAQFFSLVLDDGQDGLGVRS
jgi:hypothetical protein